MNNNINILIVEDDQDINTLLSKILQKQGYNVRSAFSGSEAQMCMGHYNFHLILLDLMIPGISGEDLIKNIREHMTMPIIVVSAKAAHDTKIQVLKLGADDFIAKPFDTEEVIARVEAQLRRYMIFSNVNSNNNMLKYKGIVLNNETHRVLVNNVEINLTAHEFCILELLMSYPKKVFTKSNIFKHVWNDTFMGDDNTINVHISNLRSKIAKVDSKNNYIQTVWGIGFKMQD